MRDEPFDALANEHRRSLLIALSENNPRTVTEDATATGDDGTAPTEHRLSTEMYHVHLPKLDAYGYVRWDEETGEVTKGPQFDELRPLLECVAETPD